MDVSVQVNIKRFFKHQLIIKYQFKNFSSHNIALESLSTRERMSQILEKVNKAAGQFVLFESLFSPEEGKAGVVVTFIAILELIKESELQVIQTDAYTPIHVKISSISIKDYE